MEKLYQQAANLVNEMIPEPWDKIYLYTEVSEDSRQVYFYYYPEGQEIPIYSLDITDKYEINEDKFNELDDLLYDCFTELWEEFKRNKQEVWTNLTFILDNTGKFKIEFGYEDLSEADLYESKVIWKYKYLGLRTKGERANKIIENYIQNLNDNEQNS